MHGTILVVDDDPLVLALLRRLLAPLGYEVREAASGEDALTVLAQFRQELVICDVRMPGMSGFGLLAAIRGSYPDTDVMLMTGFSSVEGATDALAHGAADYLLKPLRQNEILSRIQALFQRRRMHSQLAELQGKLWAHVNGTPTGQPTHNGNGCVAPIAQALGDHERQLVLDAVTRNPGHLDRAAKDLGISRTTLWRRMRKYGIH
jgi:DNA-binding NtrC family response regulator